jgi:hypothetical protein
MGQFDHLYKTARWQRLRKHQLMVQPLCAMCAEAGRVTPAVICDHVEKHDGDPTEFFTGRLQSLCKRCHDAKKQKFEKTGTAYEYECGCDADGWPLDKRHPTNIWLRDHGYQHHSDLPGPDHPTNVMMREAEEKAKIPATPAPRKSD